MALCMAMSYGPQATQVNEKPALESFLDLTLTQHFCDEDPKSQDVCIHFEVDPLRTWYYSIFSNFYILVILLQVDFAFNDELEIVYEGCYETKDTSIFAWSSILSIGHYHWLCSLIRRLPLNSKANYLICTIRCILDFLQL